MRIKFNTAEKSLLKTDTPIEWRNGSHWLPGVVIGEGYDTLGYHYAEVMNLKTTRTISKGEHTRAYPTHLRAR